MDRFTILCTKEQTKRALKLRAPLDFRNGDRPYISVEYFDEDGRLFYHNYDIPTAEQMIGWMNEQGLAFDTEWSWGGLATMWVWDNHKKELVYSNSCYSLKECTLAAIDAALDYLTKIKEEKL